jgi:uncharacterized protein (DUF433 family)
MPSPRGSKANRPARIVRDPAVCGGEPTVEGTRVPVRSIVIQWKHYRDLDRVLSAFPHLRIHDVRGALDFYESHRDEIDRLIEENERAAYATE